MKIEDGKGTGVLARVDGNQRLHVNAVTVLGISNASHNAGTAHIFNTGVMNLPASEANVFYIKNTGPLDMIFHRIHFCYNGGNTNSNKAIILRSFSGSTVPTANNSLILPPASNLSSSNTAGATFYVWDGVGAGMTITNQGSVFQSTIGNQGLNQLNVEGQIVVTPGKIFMMSLEAEEAGTGTICLQAFFGKIGT